MNAGEHDAHPIGIRELRSFRPRLRRGELQARCDQYLDEAEDPTYSEAPLHIPDGVDPDEWIRDNLDKIVSEALASHQIRHAKPEDFSR